MAEVAESKKFQDSYRKITAHILPELMSGGISTEKCKELETELDHIIIFLQTASDLNFEEICLLLQKLREALFSISHQNEELEQKIEGLHQLNAVRIEEKMNKLEQEFTSLKTDLLTGQIASSLEKEMVKRILHGATVAGKNMITAVTLYEIDDILQGGKGSRFLPSILQTPEQKKIAEKNWEKLDEQFKFDNLMYSFIKEVKDNRNTLAHPSVPWTKAHELIMFGEFVNGGKEECLKMLCILKDMGVKTIGN